MRGRTLLDWKKKTLVDSHWWSEPGIVPRRVASCASAGEAERTADAASARTVEARIVPAVAGYLLVGVQSEQEESPRLLSVSGTETGMLHLLRKSKARVAWHARRVSSRAGLGGRVGLLACSQAAVCCSSAFWLYCQKGGERTGSAASPLLRIAEKSATASPKPAGKQREQQTR